MGERFFRSEEIIVIDEVGDGDTYSWKLVQVLLAKDYPDKLYYRWGSGCSCDCISMEEAYELDDYSWPDFTNRVFNYTDSASGVEFLAKTLPVMKMDPYERLDKALKEGPW